MNNYNVIKESGIVGGNLVVYSSTIDMWLQEGHKVILEPKLGSDGVVTSVVITKVVPNGQR